MQHLTPRRITVVIDIPVDDDVNASILLQANMTIQSISQFWLLPIPRTPTF